MCPHAIKLHCHKKEQFKIAKAQQIPLFLCEYFMFTHPVKAGDTAGFLRVFRDVTNVAASHNLTISTSETDSTRTQEHITCSHLKIYTPYNTDTGHSLLSSPLLSTPYPSSISNFPKERNSPAVASNLDDETDFTQVAPQCLR